MITITTFKWVPPFAQGFVRDIRLRWACEEAGIPYQVRLVGFEDVQTADYRREQPFGQVPTCLDGSLSLFESGSILLHLGERSPKLLPPDPAARARAVTWVFAAMNSIEPFVQNLNRCEPSEARFGDVSKLLRNKLSGLEMWLKDREYLEASGFSVGDLLMACVLREAKAEVLAEYPAVNSYLDRCLARPGFKKALADQLASIAAHAPA